MDVLKLKMVGRIDYSMCFIRPPLCDKVCEGWIGGKKLDERLYFDVDFWCLSTGSKDYLWSLGYTDYIIEVDGATNEDSYWKKRRFEKDEELPVMKLEKENVGRRNEDLDALIDEINSI